VEEHDGRCDRRRVEPPRAEQQRELLPDALAALPERLGEVGRDEVAERAAQGLAVGVAEVPRVTRRNARDLRLAQAATGKSTRPTTRGARPAIA